MSRMVWFLGPVARPLPACRLWLLIGFALGCSSRVSQEPLVPPDHDGDGYDALLAGGDDCDDEDAAVHPGAADPVETTGPWAIEPVTDQASDWPAVAVGPGGVVHAAYGAWPPCHPEPPEKKCFADEMDKSLTVRHARRVDGAWSTAEVDGMSDAGLYTSLAVDGEGFAHIAYYRIWDDQYSEALRYATDRGGTWAVQTPDPAAPIAYHTAIHVRDDGAVTIAYRDVVHADPARDDDPFCVNDEPCDAALALAVADAKGNWTIEHVEVGGSLGWDPAMAADAVGTIHLAYPSLDPSDDLRYARGRPGAWSIEAVEQEGRVGQATAIAIDAAGAVHIAYHRYNPKGYGREVRYATNAGGRWRIESVEERDNLQEATRIAVDTLGRVHVTYVDFAAGSSLRHATRSAQGWEVEVVAEGVWGGFDMKSVFGALHVVYATDGGLEYARFPLATDQDCDGEDG